MILKHQSGALKAKSVDSYGGKVHYYVEGSVAISEEQTYKYVKYKDVTISNAISLVADTPEILINLSPSNCVITGANTVGSMTGNVDLVVRGGDGGAKYLNYLRPTGSGVSIQKYTSDTLIGSLGKHLEDQWAARFSTKTPGDVGQLAWSQYSATTTGFVSGTPNNDSIVSGLNVSGISAWRAGFTDDRFPLTLISPRHAVTAAHTLPGVGTQFTFRRSDGTTQTVTVAARKTIAGRDAGMVYFNEAITGISPYAVISAAGESRTCGISSPIPERLLCLVKALHRPNGTTASYWGLNYIYAMEAAFFNISFGASGIPSRGKKILNPVGDAFGASRGIGGDSGSPIFLLIAGSLYLVGVWATSGGGIGNLMFIDTLLNQDMNTLAASMSDPAAGTYAVSLAELSSFATYT